MQSRKRMEDAGMRCPKCKRLSLKRREEGVVCSFCGYVLTPGEEVRYRLFEMLR